MRGFENYRILDANADQISNRKKAAIIDALIQVLPERELLILFREQPLEEGNTAGIAFFAIDFGYIFPDKRGHLRAATHQRAEAIARRFKSQTPIGGGFRRPSIRAGKLRYGRDNPGVFVERGSIFPQKLFESIVTMIENRVIRTRSEGK